MKIGILGGSFNPVHNGHIILARRAKESFGLDKVIFMPAGNPYLKSEVLPLNDRVKILEAAVGDEFEVSLLEADETKPTYSCDTFEYLNKTYQNDSFYFILGYDCLENFRNWRSPERILANCEIIAASRGGSEIRKMREIADDLQQRFGGSIHILEFEDIDISSTCVRKRTADGDDIRGLIPDRAADVIYDNGYYKGKN
ncbi:MAG: nicotinate-nucleotide adenylyltransferase [Lachnospiraceae bacterium]|nr:nicotinate-nucleotide adenylyltransferase [Lachnospiraceae bacterium]MBR6302577.1 nicotinate-nucleotide adenylyltransferase [Lachnospiraceae bacterium]MBR6908680.1 nicotinate-nucleotide adenylyltransferase [Lachnospiraceae bacterium]